MDTVLPALVVLVNWTLPSFLDKKSLELVPPRDMTLNKYMIGGVISLGVLLFLGNKYNLENNKKVYSQVLWLTLLSMLSHVMYYRLLTTNDASTLMIVLNPLNILAAALVGWYMFGEAFNSKMWIGVVGIVVGLVVFLKGKMELK